MVTYSTYTLWTLKKTVDFSSWQPFLCTEFRFGNGLSLKVSGMESIKVLHKVSIRWKWLLGQERAE